MNVLIMVSGAPYIDGTDIFVPFTAIGKSEEDLLQVSFRVQYGWGATLAQKRTAILNAATQAKQDYENAHGVILPAVNHIEILGI